MVIAEATVVYGLQLEQNISPSWLVSLLLLGCFGIKRSSFLGPSGRLTPIPGLSNSETSRVRGRTMSRVCMVTGKKPVTGNNVSHANNKTRRRFSPNIHTHRFWVESEKRFVKLRISTKGMRIIDKLGIDSVLAEIRAKGVQV